MAIAEQLLKSPNREALVADATTILDAEVAGKSGLSGKFVKVAFRGVKSVRPGFVPHAIDDLLNDFVHQIERLSVASCIELKPCALFAPFLFQRRVTLNGPI